MPKRSVAALHPGDVITHDGTNSLTKPVPVRSVANSELRVPAPKEGKPLLPMSSGGR